MDKLVITNTNDKAMAPWNNYKTIGLITFLVAAGIILWLAADVLLLIFMGILVAILLIYLSEFLQDHTPLNYGWSLTVVLLLILILVAAALGLAGARIASETDNLAGDLQEAWTQLGERVGHYGWAKQLISQSEQFSLSKIPESFLGHVTGVFGATMGAMSSSLLIVFVAIFVAVDPQLYHRGLILLVPIQKRDRVEEVTNEIGEKLRWWFIGQIFSMAVVGLSTAAGLWLLGVPFFLTLGTLAGILTFIPNFGPIISAIPAILLGLGSGPLGALYVVILYLGVQAVESNLLTPLIQQNNVKLPPVLAVGMQVLMGVLAGLPGLITAAPLAVVAKILVQRFYIEDTLGDRLKQPN